MNIGKRFYWAVALIAVLALAGAAVTFTSRLTSAGGSTPPADACAQQDEADDAAEAAGGTDSDAIEDECGPQDEADDANEAGNDTVVPCSDPTGADDDAAEANGAPDTDNIEEQCGPQDEADDGEAQVPSGKLDDGNDLLPQAGITIDAAIAAAQSAASGSIGEVDLEHWNGTLVFNVDVGDKDVKVDASNGTVLSADKDD